jgi:dihydroflavonol-4-reductase
VVGEERMRALVTGATGFLGSRIAARLCARGVKVRALVRSTSNRRRLSGLSIDFAEGDVTDRPSVERAVEGVEVVYHSAALYELGTPDPERMSLINVGGTQNVLEASAAQGATAVHVSSVVALGPTGEAPVSESHWAGDAPRSSYERTKREAHLWVRRWAAQGAAVRIGLPATIYGPDDPSLTGQFHAFYARGLVRVGALRGMKMSLVHVDDCAEGLIRIAEHGQNGGEYILCGQSLTIGQWLEGLAQACGRKPPSLFFPSWVVRAAAPALAVVAPLAGLRAALVQEGLAMSGGVHWSFDGDKARRELGFAPRALDAGLREVMEFYKKEPAPRAA